MTYLMLTLRGSDEPADPFYPIPGAEPNSIEPEDGDGDVRSFRVEAIRTSIRTASEPETQLDEIGDLKATLWITDRRAAFASSRFSGGGPVSGYGTLGATVALAANAIRQAVLNNEMKGRSLVAQVRYEWLIGVIARDRGFKKPNQVQLFYKDPEQDGTYDMLTLQLENRELASPVAKLIAERAARHKASLAADESKRAALLAYAANPTSDVSASKARTFMLP